MLLSSRFAYLATETGPKMLTEALKLLGTAEVPGPKSNPVILAMAGAVGAASYYHNDDTPWCALFCSYVAKLAGKALPPDPLAARNWAHFGTPVAAPMLGDIVVFPHHVALYVGETTRTYSLLGGNQGDRVSIVDFLKAGAIAFRRPVYNQQPDNVRRILLTVAGPVGVKIV
ncbi:uncharacterized protein (TIGR02594 family) [Hymenobacter sp. UYAg731]